MWSFPVSNVLLAQDANLNIRCVVCSWQVCSRTCLAGHRERFSCHNTTCPYYWPLLFHPQPATNTAVGDRSDPAANSSSTSVTDVAPAESPTEVPNDSTTNENATVSLVETDQEPPRDNLVFRETTTREWYVVNGQVIAPMNGQPLSLRGIHSTVSSTKATTEGQQKSKPAA